MLRLESSGLAVSAGRWRISRHVRGTASLFYDPAPDLNVPDYLRERITRLDSLEELMMRAEYVFGSSGRNPFKGRWPMAHRPGIKLFSASGGDQEFGPIIRYLQRCSDFKVASDSWDITSEAGPSGPIRIAFLGYPYNFVSRTEAAVPTPIVQLETAGLLAGLIEARIYLESVEEDHEQDTRIHRVSPDAQKFIYEAWQLALKNRGIDIRELYGYDPALLAATQCTDWLADNSEPRSLLRHRVSPACGKCNPGHAGAVLSTGTLKRSSVPRDNFEWISSTPPAA